LAPCPCQSHPLGIGSVNPRAQIDPLRKAIPMNIFYSWQSDLNHDTHLKFIRTALEQAIARAGSDLNLEEANRPQLDEAAKNRVGAENIVSTILRKIEAAAVYVADVTPITTTERGRLVPNPNVVFELGWASRAINYERTIMVMNIADGHEIKDMPFDIVQRPIITFSLKPSSSAERREKELKRLADALTGAIATNHRAHHPAGLQEGHHAPASPFSRPFAMEGRHNSNAGRLRAAEGRHLPR
jgi:hypothetical protein